MAKKQVEPQRKQRRQGNKRWKRIYGLDRKYTRRVDRVGRKHQ